MPRQFDDTLRNAIIGLTDCGNRVSKQESRVGNILGALGAVVTFGGYVLVVGAVVAWLNLQKVHVPVVSVVADMPRNELFGIGFETLAAWLLLALIITVTITIIGSTVRNDPLLPLTALVVSTVIGGVFAGIWQIDSVALSVVVTVALAASIIASLAVLYSRDLEPGDELIPLGGAIVFGLALGVGFELLLINHAGIVGGITAFLALVVAVWLAIEMFWRREVARKGSYSMPGVPFIRKIRPDPPTGPEARRTALLRSSRHRSIVAIVVLAVILACGAIKSHTSSKFWAARLTMTNGTCVSGTLLVRNSDEVLLATLERKVDGEQVKDGFVEIPASMISNVQVIGPPRALRQVEAERCAKALQRTPPEPFAPYPLVGESTAPEVDPPVTAVPGPEGKEGKRGPEGERGPEGKEGKRGPEGERGPAGRSGATGKTGARGARGPRGSRGEPGPRGPRGLSDVDGS